MVVLVVRCVYYNCFVEFFDPRGFCWKHSMKRLLEAREVRPKNFIQIVISRDGPVGCPHELAERAHADLRANDSVAKMGRLFNAFGVHRAKQGQSVAWML